MKLEVYDESKKEPDEKTFTLRLRDGGLCLGNIFVQMYRDDGKFIDNLIAVTKEGFFIRPPLFSSTRDTGIKMDGENRIVESGAEEGKKIDIADEMITALVKNRWF